MDCFGIVLRALHYLLMKTGAEDWAKWIANDIIYWSADNSVEHYLSAFGGAGSLNDVVLSKNNGHAIVKEQEIWANALLSELNQIGYQLAKSNETDELVEIGEILQSIVKKNKVIEGFKCAHCGCSEISSNGLDYYIAPLVITSEITKALGISDFTKVVDKCLDMKAAEIQLERDRVKQIIKDSSINYTNKSQPMEICTKCGSKNINICHWTEKHKKGFFGVKDKTVFVVAK